MIELKTLDDVVSMLISEHYYWVQTRDDEGFWIRANDMINSYFDRDVKMGIRRLARVILTRIDKHSTRNVNEVLSRLQEINTFMIKDFVSDPNIVHFNDALYFVKENILLPTKNLTPEQFITLQKLQDTHNIKSFCALPHAYPDHHAIPIQVAAESGSLPISDQSPVTLVEPDCPKFKGFMAKVIPRQQRLMWDWIAYLLTLNVDLKKSVFMVGETDTGKTTLVKILRVVLGRQNCSSETFHSLCQNAFSRAGLEAKLLNYDDDVSGLIIRDPGEFKKLTGDDTLRVERKHMNPYDTCNTCKLMFSTNKIPYIEHLDKATANRIILFFFSHQFTNEEKNTNFVSSIIDDPKEIEGILYNAIKVLPALMTKGRFDDTMDIDSVMHYLRMAIEPVYTFLCMCCVGVIDIVRRNFKVNPDSKTPPTKEEEAAQISEWKSYSIPSDPLFDEFTSWAAATGREGKDKDSHINTINKFTGVLRRYGILGSVDRISTETKNITTGKKSVTVRTYHGVKLREDYDKFRDDGYPETIDDMLPEHLRDAMRAVDEAKGTNREATLSEEFEDEVKLELLQKDRAKKNMANVQEFFKKQEADSPANKDVKEIEPVPDDDPDIIEAEHDDNNGPDHDDTDENMPEV